MAYDKIINRENASALESTQQIVNEIIQGVAEESQILPLMTRLPDMTSSQASMPVLSALPEAYWVEGDTGLKQTTSMAWRNKFIYAKEVAVIIPLPKAVLDDSDYDIWGQVKPRAIEAARKVIDEAIITGNNKPAGFRDGLIGTIVASGNTVPYNAQQTTYERISDAMTKVEEDGYDVSAILGGITLKGEFRKGLVDANGQPLANSEITELPKVFVKNGAWDNDVADFIVGDFKQAVYSFRQDATFDIFDTGVITDGEGRVVYNLLQQDMLALRMVLRFGWELPNGANITNPDEASRLPFALAETNAETNA